MMSRPVRRRFWIERVAFSLAVFVTVLTVSYPDWFERLFNADPDKGTGALEIALAASAAGISIVMGILAGGEWIRAEWFKPSDQDE
jgi:hypothetical protein